MQIKTFWVRFQIPTTSHSTGITLTTEKCTDLVLDLIYFCFSNPNPTHLPKHQTPTPNHQFYLLCTILLCARAHGVKTEISLDTGYARYGWSRKCCSASSASSSRFTRYYSFCFLVRRSGTTAERCAIANSARMQDDVNLLRAMTQCTGRDLRKADRGRIDDLAASKRPEEFGEVGDRRAKANVCLSFVVQQRNVIGSNKS